MFDNYGFSFTDFDTIDFLEKAKVPKDEMSGTPWY